MTTYYQMLGVSPSATPEAIKAAYRKILKGSHPDLHRDDAAAEQRSKHIIDAYTVLRNPDQRAQYDRWLQHGRLQRGRLLLITLLVSMGAAAGASLIVMQTLLAPEPPARRIASDHGNAPAAAQPLAARAQPPVAAPREPLAAASREPSAAPPPGPSAAEAAATAPAGFLPPLPRWAAWMMAESTADPLELLSFSQEHPGTPEAGFADARLVQWINAAENIGALERLQPLLTGALAERVQSRIARLGESGDVATAALPERAPSLPEISDASHQPRVERLAGMAQPLLPATATPDATMPRLDAMSRAPHPDDLNRAIALLNRMIVNDPRNPEAYMRRGAAWLSKGDTDRALVDYSAAISLDRSSITAFHQRGLLWLRHGDVERALADLDQAIRMSFTDPLIYRDRGMIWYEMGRYDRALADFDRAIKLSPDFAHPYFLRGLAFQRKGDPIRATANFEEARRRDPSFANASRQ
jgi:tetratricopeptide (TPR) repeat protein